MNADIYDLCIVGAGMFGSSAAFHASANPSLKVCLIGPDEPTEAEKSTREIFSSYYDEGRIINVVNCVQPLQVLSKLSVSRFQDLEKLSGIPFYYPVGTLVAAERKSPDLYQWLQALQLNGVPYLDLSNVDVMRKRFPFLELDECFHPFFDDSGAGHISPRNLVKAQTKVAEMQGCVIVKEVVIDVKDLTDGIHQVVTENGSLIKARRILFCTGAFTKFKNLQACKMLKFEVHRETAALLEISKEEKQRLSSMPSMILFKRIAGMPSSTRGVYILPPIQYPNGKYYLKIGPAGHQRNSEIKTLQEAKEWYSSCGDDEIMNVLPELLSRWIPGLKVEEIVPKVCITCDSPTGLPYIDRLSPTVAVAAIGNGAGATTCVEIGRIAAHLITTGKWDSVLPKSIFEAVFDD